MTVIIVKQPRFNDQRGWFTESWNRSKFAALGVDVDFCQDNHSYSAEAGTLRGLHYQAPPFAQGKLVRCIRGSIFDVAVDIRSGSPTWGKFVSRILSSENGEQLWIPEGYAHGFVTLEPDCEVVYKVTAPYDRDSERGIIWNDEDLGIDWPLPRPGPMLSDKDRILPRLRDVTPEFIYADGPLVPLD